MAVTVGIGQEAYGDPFGSGGTLHLRNATCIDGQTVRLAFDDLPLAQSPGGANDGLNPSNYSFTLLYGEGHTPLAVGVKPDVVEGPARGLAVGQFGLDVQVDAPLAQALIYRVQVSTKVGAALGGFVGFPYTADFRGMVVPKVTTPKPRQGNIDFANPGGYVVDSSGDIALDDELTSYKKRIIRRVTTPKNAFRHLPGYGVSLELKKPMSVRRIGAVRLDIIQQVKEEPETDTVTVTVDLNAAGYAIISISAKTKKGAIVTAGVRTSSDGIVIV